MIAPAKKTPPCTACKQPIHDIPTRGLCRACYMSLTRAVRMGVLSWEDCEATGVCNAPKVKPSGLAAILERFPALRKRLAGKKESATAAKSK